MDQNIKISATIVLFNQEVSILKNTVTSFLNIPVKKRLYLVDNASKESLQSQFVHEDIEYIRCTKNNGFSAGHNKVIDSIKNLSEYHLILNPDVSFTSDTILNLIQKLEKLTDVVMISPRVIFPNQAHQYTCRKHPTFKELVLRKLGINNRYVQEREYRDYDLNKPFNPEFIHGCFYLFKTEEFVKLQGFDEDYFLYMEDADICKRIEVSGNKILYYPEETITHVLNKGSSKKIRLFWIHVVSSIKYFKKWGF